MIELLCLSLEYWSIIRRGCYSISEFRYAVYSGSIWNEWVELDDELFLTDEGEGVWLSILKYYNVVCSFLFNHKFHNYS